MEQERMKDGTDMSAASQGEWQARQIAGLMLFVLLPPVGIYLSGRKYGNAKKTFLNLAMFMALYVIALTALFTLELLHGAPVLIIGPIHLAGYVFSSLGYFKREDKFFAIIFLALTPLMGIVMFPLIALLLVPTHAYPPTILSVLLIAYVLYSLVSILNLPPLSLVTSDKAPDKGMIIMGSILLVGMFLFAIYAVGITAYFWAFKLS